MEFINTVVRPLILTAILDLQTNNSVRKTRLREYSIACFTISTCLTDSHLSARCKKYQIQAADWSKQENRIRLSFGKGTCSIRKEVRYNFKK